MTERPSQRVGAPRTEVRGMDLRSPASGIYHVWFSPKRRAHALQGDIRLHVLESLDQIARERHILLIECESLPDHIHLLLRLSEALTLPQAMRHLKGASARRIFQLMPELRSDLNSDHFWQRGYGARPVEIGAISTIRKYIKQHRSDDTEPRTSVRGVATLETERPR